MAATLPPPGASAKLLPRGRVTLLCPRTRVSFSFASFIGQANALLAIATFAWAAAPGPTSAPPSFAVSAYDVYSGLPHHGAPVLLQTHDGYLWIGTESGLARFDGVRFVTYRSANTPALPANLIRCLFEDRDGWLWIGTQAGLVRERAGRFQTVGLDRLRIAAICQDPSGAIWIATEDAGMFEYRGGRLVAHAGDAGMPADSAARFVFADASGRLWVLFRTAGIFVREGGTWRAFSTAPFDFHDFSRMTESPHGTFWIGTETNGVLRVRGGEVRRYGTENGLGSGSFRSVLADRRGQIWVVTNALYVLRQPDDDRFVRVPLAPVENCREIIQDREGSYWVGSAGDGVVRIRPSGFQMLSAESGPWGGNTRTVAIDTHGSLWAGLANTGAARLDPNGTVTVLDTARGNAGEVWSICPARSGEVWIGARGALHRRTAERDETLAAYERVRALFEDSRGNIWIGSESAGVTRYHDGQFTPMVEAIQARQKTRSPSVAMAFAEAHDGTIFIGLRDTGGIVAIKGDAITVYQDLPSNDIRAIYEDRDGMLWVGTKGRGLILRRDGHWLNPESFSEPFNDQVSAVLEDAQGRLWLGTPKGLVWAPKADFLALAAGRRSAGAFRLALAGDGVRPGTIGAGSSPNAAQAADGRMWFASRHGIVAVDPGSVVTNDVVPPVQVERVLVDHTPVATDAPIALPAGTRSLAIEYTALSFVRPNQVNFRYRLDGRDGNWIDAGPQRTALYADLPPGDYQFHVIACNDDGVWNDTGASVAIVQRPFFFQTGWFYAAMAISLLGAGLGAYRWRTAALLRRNQELERAIAERTAELVKSAAAIRESEFFYHSLVESLPQIIVRKDTAGRFTYANAAFGELVGRPLSAIIGHTDADVYHADDAQKFRADDLRVMQTRQPLEYEDIVERDGKKRFLHVKKVPLHDQQGGCLGVQLLFWDMTSLREIEEKLKQAQRDLIETSRLAGIAEMATGILHNLGNALTSVNTTANLALARMRDSKVASLRRVAEMLAGNERQLAEFLARDTRGQQLPTYLSTLSEHLLTERDEIVRELEALQENVNHIKDLVASQQQYARVAGVTEIMSPSELVELALRISESALLRHGIVVVRELMPTPAVKVERQKALQIVSNLLQNAKDSLVESQRKEARIVLGVRATPEGRAQVYVSDNGLGIAPENLTRIFAFGFTTKRHGHGFGLHSSALAARELGGTLTAQSDGLGHGATFILELPSADQVVDTPTSRHAA